MSLIDEALKRARQEASRQEAAERDARYARVPVYVPPARRGRPWVLPAVVAACLAVGIAGGLLLARRSPPAVAPEVTPPEATAQDPHPLAPSPATPPAHPGRGGTLAEVREERHPSRPPSPGVGEGSGGRGGQGVRASKPAPPSPSLAPAPVPPPSPPAAAPSPAVDPGPVIDLPQTPPAEPASYVREVPVPGGGSLRLNGIAFSARPVALFGDKVVAPGERVGAFTVVAIDAQRVKLQGPGGIVYVTLK